MVSATIPSRPGQSETLLRGKAGWLASGLGTTLLFGFAAAVMPATAIAVSTGDEQYAAALRLKPDLDRGAGLFELCAGCHGRDGDGASDGRVPAIAGQIASVLVKQLVDFRHDSRHSIRVQGFISHHQLSAQDLADVAAYVRSLPPRRPAPLQEGPQTAQGAALFAAVCAKCHGAQGEGDSGTRVPRLAGQHSQYLAEQLRDAAMGNRPGMERDHSRLLAQLSGEDIDALSGYLAGVAPTASAPLVEPGKAIR